MKPVIPAIALLAFALSACDAERAPEAADAPPAAADAAADPAAPPPLDQPAQEIPPATAPAPDAGQAPDPGLARWDGYGDMRFGMSAEEAKQAWGGELVRLGGEGDPCYFLTPKWVKVPAELAFMIEDGKFVRYGTESEKTIAPGGGRRGMAAGEIEALYPGRVDEMPHKYVQGGKYLNVDSEEGDGKLVFEVGGDGKVTEWRVGVPPQVDYVEGCG